ncbi:5-formyltetrahydrofolate cyclo-ligase [Sphingomonas sp. 1P06PA]|uniref:5-formyltetrahydrofolate cyclo-ligase n=1 Tax=Sphingomonas sp. 1P06PA TaxID=554121 RepID=UPI0039A43138
MRHLLRERRAAHAADPLHAAACAAIAARVIARLDCATAIVGYRSMPGEVDPAAILDAAHARGCTIALPHITARDRPMRFLRWRPGDALVRGPFGIQQPAADAEPIEPDLILAPLLGFDASGGRIGMGAGFYDRAFAAYPQARRIGLARADQQVPLIPRDPWDIALHAIATEEDWILPS